MKMSIETEFLLDSERKRLLGRWLAGLLAVPAAGALIFFATIAVGKMEDPVIASAGNISIHRSDLEALMSDIDSNTRSRVLNDTQAMSALVRRDLGRRLLSGRTSRRGSSARAWKSLQRPTWKRMPRRRRRFPRKRK
jgi:hypothetical protein